MVCLHYQTAKPILRQMKMGCVRFCGGVHSAQKTDDSSDFHSVLSTCYRYLSRSRSRSRAVCITDECLSVTEGCVVCCSVSSVLH